MKYNFALWLPQLFNISSLHQRSSPVTPFWRTGSMRTARPGQSSHPTPIHLHTISGRPFVTPYTLLVALFWLLPFIPQHHLTWISPWKSFLIYHGLSPVLVYVELTWKQEFIYWAKKFLSLFCSRSDYITFLPNIFQWLYFTDNKPQVLKKKKEFILDEWHMPFITHTM